MVSANPGLMIVKTTSEEDPAIETVLVIQPHDKLPPPLPTSVSCPGGIEVGHPVPEGVKGSPSPPSKVTPANTKQLLAGVIKDEAVINEAGVVA
jgi:hypothetical protein